MATASPRATTTPRPHALTLAALAVVALLVAGCGAPSQPRGPAPAATQAAPAAAKPASSAPSAPSASTGAAGDAASGGGAGQAAQPYRPTPLSPSVPVRLAQIGGASDAGIYIAQEKGYFADEGLDVELIPFQTTAAMIPLLGAGQLDVATGALAVGVFNAAARDVQMRLVADKGSTPGPEWDFAGLMVRKDLVESGRVRDYADLRGLTIARPTAQGTVPEASVAAALRKGGLQPEDAQSAVVAFPDMPAAFANGAVEVAIVIEPFIAAIEQRGSAVRWRGNSEFYGNQQIAVIMYGPNLLGARPDVGQRWMNAYVRALRFYNDAFGPKQQGRDEAIQILIKHTPVKDRATYDHMRPPGLDPDGRMQLDAIRADLAFWEGQGLVTERVDLARVLDTSFQENAVRELGPYRP
jgi:NitT/TauT family transport system substrate-binding protein